MKPLLLASLLLLAGQAAAGDAGWIRVTTTSKTLLFRPDGTGRTEAAAAHEAFRRQLSPDGTRLLYVGTDSEQPLLLGDAQGKNPRRLSPEGMMTDFPTWSPDGRRVAFAGRRDGQWQIHQMDADGGNLRQLTSSPNGARLPKFGPDGRLAYLVYREPLGKLQPADLMVFDGKDALPVVSNVYITQYVWSPNGKTLAIGKAGALVFLEVRSGKTREIPFPRIDPRLDSHAAFAIAWRPDSRAVACSITFLGGRRHGGPKLFGDDEFFVIPRQGKPRWFRHGEPVQQIEWIKHR
jgi:WD40 repeat protein